MVEYQIVDNVDAQRAAVVRQVHQKLDEIGLLVVAHQERIATVVVRVEVVLDREVGGPDEAKRLDRPDQLGAVLTQLRGIEQQIVVVHQSRECFIEESQG